MGHFFPPAAAPGFGSPFPIPIWPTKIKNNSLDNDQSSGTGIRRDINHGSNTNNSMDTTKTIKTPETMRRPETTVRSPKFIWALCARLYSMAETPQPFDAHPDKAFNFDDDPDKTFNLMPVRILSQVQHM